ncbi:hypothetical protein FUAX_09070 [Fulvitalea axinellae]|uniref:Outer membrane protein beta-barrel domain-containing protein n=1 Tax=Fulvitalea axinellae TaxID=1182444 RepID=A0AAU9D8A3_9BACT|nr:hypothetical protein FUAX_09070 [Fulvitalea axinellae]
MKSDFTFRLLHFSFLLLSVTFITVSSVDAQIVIKDETIRIGDWLIINDWDGVVVAHEKPADRHRFSPYLDLGINNWVTPSSQSDVPNVKGWGSWYVGLGVSKVFAVNKHIRFNTGVGFSWYNFKFKEDDYRLVNLGDKAGFEKETDPNIKSLKSKLTISYLDAKLIPTLNFPKSGFSFGVGMYGGIKLTNYTKIKYKEDGDKDKDKDFDRNHVNNFRYGLRGELTFGHRVKLFGTYDLNRVFPAGEGPKLHPFVFGVTVFSAN